MSKFENNRIFLPIYPERSLSLHSMLVSCGHQYITSDDYRWDGMKRGGRELVIWQYTVSGCGHLRLEDEEFELKPGQAMLLKIPERHTYYFKPQSGHWELLFLTLYGSEIIRLWTELRRRIGGALIRHEDNSISLQTARKIITAGLAQELDNQFVASALTYQFTMELLQEFAPSSRIDLPPELIGKVRDYCMKRLDRKITIDDMAQAAGYSRFHFIRIFHKYHGMPPMAFVNDLRMRLAVRLFQTERLSVKETANRCGFDSVSYFCKVFRQRYGKTPAQFRDYNSREESRI